VILCGPDVIDLAVVAHAKAHLLPLINGYTWALGMRQACSPSLYSLPLKIINKAGGLVYQRNFAGRF
jgi:hypothetical protein